MPDTPQTQQDTIATLLAPFMSRKLALAVAGGYAGFNGQLTWPMVVVICTGIVAIAAVDIFGKTKP